MKQYEIKGTKYFQDALTIGQLKQIIKKLHTIELFENLRNGSFSASVLLNLLGTEVPSFLAIILCKEGTELKDKKLDEFEKEIEFIISMELCVEIINDFFVVTSPSLLWEKMEKMMEQMFPAEKKE